MGGVEWPEQCQGEIKGQMRIQTWTLGWAAKSKSCCARELRKPRSTY